MRRGIDSFKTSGSSNARIENSSSTSSGDKAGTTAPRFGHDGDQTLSIELPQGFADRNPADVILDCDGILPQLSALRNLSANNLVAQLIGHR